jgi:hypothetical protein
MHTYWQNGNTLIAETTQWNPGKTMLHLASGRTSESRGNPQIKWPLQQRKQKDGKVDSDRIEADLLD